MIAHTLTDTAERDGKRFFYSMRISETNKNTNGFERDLDVPLRIRQRGSLFN